MIFLELVISFAKIGFASFGGLSMIPQITSEMLSHGWMTMSEVTDLVAIAEMTPGPLGLNCATFAGIQAAGIPGAIAANLGVLMPTFTLCAIAALFFESFKHTHTMAQLMVGIRPAALGMILGVLLSLGTEIYFPERHLDLFSFVLCMFDLLLLLKWKISVPLLIILNASIGIAMHLL